MKFAYIIMGDFDFPSDRAYIRDGSAQIIGVKTVEQACEVAKSLVLEGIDCIELCGAFREDNALKVIAATENKTPIGFVTHFKEQDPLYKALFGN